MKLRNADKPSPYGNYTFLLITVRMQNYPPIIYVPLVGSRIRLIRPYVVAAVPSIGTFIGHAAGMTDKMTSLA